METNNGKQGGELKGKLHVDGGMPVVITNANNKPIEVETNEVIINRHSAQCSKEECSHTFDGKEMSNKEILSEINQEKGNGVPIFENGGDIMEQGGGIIRYNGMPVPKTVKPNMIISAFSNPVDYDKVEIYAEIMKAEMLSHEFPPIMGYPAIIDENDIGNYFLDGEEITEEHIGKNVWMVTDGHHRSLASIKANLPYIEVELDYSTITDPEDLKQFEKKALGGEVEDCDKVDKLTWVHKEDNVVAGVERISLYINKEDETRIEILQIDRHKAFGSMSGDSINSIWIDVYNAGLNKLKTKSGKFLSLNDIKNKIAELIDNGDLVKFQRPEISSTALKSLCNKNIEKEVKSNITSIEVEKPKEVWEMTFDEFSADYDKPKQEVIEDYELAIVKLKEKYDKINNTKTYADDLSKAFSLGMVGFMKEGSRGRKLRDSALEKTIDNAVKSIEIRDKIAFFEQRLKSYKAGKVNSNGQPKIFTLSKLKSLIEASEKALKSGILKDKKLSNDELINLKESLSFWKRDFSNKTKKHKELHIKAIKQALAKNKNVPIEVLNEYPEFKKEPCITGKEETTFSKVINGQVYKSIDKVFLAFDNAKDLKDYLETIPDTQKSMYPAKTDAKYSFFIPQWHNDNEGNKLYFSYNKGSNCPYEFSTLNSKMIQVIELSANEITKEELPVYCEKADIEQKIIKVTNVSDEQVEYYKSLGFKIKEL
jgi:hypothetical protein